MKKKCRMSTKNGMKSLKIMLALILAWSMVFAPISAFAEESTDWQVEKSKTASPLDENNQTTVTLGLPANESEISNVEVVFVLDESYQQEYTAPVITLLDNLIDTENLVAKIGVVKFDAWAHDAYSLAVNDSEIETGLVELNSTTQENLVKALNYRLREDGNRRLGGSNTEMPLRMAQGMLDNGDASAEKYIVFCSDLRAYVWEGQVTIDGEAYSVPASRIGNSVEHQGNLSHQPLYNSFDQLIAAYTDGTLTGRADYDQDAFFRWGSSGASWNTYWTRIYQDSVPFNTTLTAAEYGAYEDTWQQTVDPKLYGFDKSLGLTYDAFNASIDAGTNFMLISDFAPQAGPLGYNTWVDLILPDFIQYMGDEGADVYELANGDTVDDAMTDFDTKVTAKITNYKVASGSLKDEIGDKFDLVVTDAACPFTITVNGTELAAEETGENQWSLGTKDTETDLYPYVVTYTPGDNEFFTLQINVPVETAKPVQLSYDLQLNATTQSGEFSTNKSAVLNYTDTMGVAGEETFPVPTVEYKAPVTVEYNPDGGVFAASESGLRTGASGLTIDKPVNPTKDGFVFGGWFTEKNGAGQSAPSVFPAADTVYYAKWNENKSVAQPSTPTSSDAPNTGDATDFTGLIGLLLISAAGLTMVFKHLKRTKDEY